MSSGLAPHNVKPSHRTVGEPPDDARKDDGVADVADAYAQERLQVNPPSGWRDDLMAPIKALDQAMKVADQVEAKLANVRAQVTSGNIHKDQAPVLRKQILDEARGQVESFTDTGRRVMEALPTRVTMRAWPDAMPDGTDWQTVEAEWQSVPTDESVTAFGAMVDDALARGDRKTARALMSRRGKALLANRIGREEADQFWPDLRKQATESLRQVGGTDGDPGIAMEQLEAVERAFATGTNLAAMKVDAAEYWDARTDGVPR